MTDYRALIDYAFLASTALLCIFYTLMGLDDFLIDVIAGIKRLRPRFLNHKEVLLLNQPEARIAIIVPAWKEHGIIGRMIRGNCGRLEYSRFHFFIGVYPNDPATMEEVAGLTREFSNVHMVVNHLEGPTTKAQMLNCVIREVLHCKGGGYFKAIQMQDAEDIIHPKLLKLVNAHLKESDFIQTPVFSLTRSRLNLVGGSYMDEFAENHTKDMLVRSHLGAAIPSAGVGTTLSIRLLRKMTRGGMPAFNEGSLTEDYELGIRSQAAGYRSKFLCCYYQDAKTGRYDYIATREYFPTKLRTSIRQKSRWTLGIALQGWKNLGWIGSLVNRYFLYRDRKGLVSNCAVIAGYGYLLSYVTYSLPGLSAGAESSVPWDLIASSGWLPPLMAVNLCLMVNRFAQRSLCVYRVYGLAATAPVILRWPVSCLINGLATILALKKYAMAKWRRESLSWGKTTHALPADFGEASESIPRSMSQS